MVDLTGLEPEEVVHGLPLADHARLPLRDEHDRRARDTVVRRAEGERVRARRRRAAPAVPPRR